MKILLSWSGDRAKEVGAFLNVWLKDTIQAIEPQFSPDILKGERWAQTLDSWLEATNFGIVILTRENLKSTWLHYEAGALAKSTSNSNICTLLIGVTSGDVERPLGNFQDTKTDKDDIRKLLATINDAMPEASRLPVDTLDRAFETQWPRLEQFLGEIASQPFQENAVPSRPQNEILDEILENTRQISRELSVASAVEPSIGDWSEKTSLEVRFEQAEYTVDNHNLLMELFHRAHVPAKILESQVVELTKGFMLRVVFQGLISRPLKRTLMMIVRDQIPAEFGSPIYRWTWFEH